MAFLETTQEEIMLHDEQEMVGGLYKFKNLKSAKTAVVI